MPRCSRTLSTLVERKRVLSVLAVCSFLVAACGGGGGGSSPTPAPATAPAATAAPAATGNGSSTSGTAGTATGSTTGTSGTTGTGATGGAGTEPGVVNGGTAAAGSATGASTIGTTATTGSAGSIASTGTGTVTTGGSTSGPTAIVPSSGAGALVPATGTGTVVPSTGTGSAVGNNVAGQTAQSVAIPLPTITTQPQALIVTAGQRASFVVSASSASAMTVQWSRDGVAIAGATSMTYDLAATQQSDSGASFTAAVTNATGAVTSAAARLTVNAVVAIGVSATRPFSDRSPWNARPTRFTLGSWQVPASYYYPTVADGEYSVTGFSASATDASMVVKGPVGAAGIYLADDEVFAPQVVIPHWPANVIAASGGDGHADIIDVAGNKIHSFWQLKQVDGQWRATQYAWTALDGRGWGTPAQYQQGARAAGVPTIAGVIRVGELDDGLPSYKHALAMSMAENGLSPSPAYTFPATSADWNASTINSGAIPEGALMMLPPDFDTSRIGNPRLLKIAQTLKTYGAYVVDANSGTPFVFYVENGTNFSLMPPKTWDGRIASELDLLRASIRQVTAVGEWVDANGVVFTPERNFNLLSMRGAWYLLSGPAAGVFDSYQQAVVFPENGKQTIQNNATGRSMPNVAWATPQPGETYKLVVTATGGATFKLDLAAPGGVVVFTTGDRRDGESYTFQWPASGLVPWLTIASGPQGGGKVSATLVKVGN